jgi:hypothetical protein
VKKFTNERLRFFNSRENAARAACARFLAAVVAVIEHSKESRDLLGRWGELVLVEFELALILPGVSADVVLPFTEALGPIVGGRFGGQLRAAAVERLVAAREVIMIVTVEGRNADEWRKLKGFVEIVAANCPSLKLDFLEKVLNKIENSDEGRIELLTTFMSGLRDCFSNRLERIATAAPRIGPSFVQFLETFAAKQPDSPNSRRKNRK